MRFFHPGKETTERGCDQLSTQGHEQQGEGGQESLTRYLFQDKIMIALKEDSFEKTDQDKQKWYFTQCLGNPCHRTL